jgi:hypothetical protein
VAIAFLKNIPKNIHNSRCPVRGKKNFDLKLLPYSMSAEVAEGEDIGDSAIKKLGFKSDFLGNNRIIWEKTDFLVKNRIIWEKIGLFGKKTDFLGKNPIFWERIRFFGK